MRILPALCLFLFTSFAWAVAPSASVTGEVLEVKDVESYTYLRLKTKDGETWAAVSKAPMKKGAVVTLENTMVMSNFESKTLHKTFPKILFGTLGGSGSPAPGAAKSLPPGHAGMARAVAEPDRPIAKAVGANAKTVAEIVTQRTALKEIGRAHV
jgi:hypothetical protein